MIVNEHDLAIFSRRAVMGDSVKPATVFVRAGRILRVEPGEPPASTPLLVNAGEHVLMPGVIDAHVHVNEPGRTEWEGFRSAGRAAAAGGVTTMVVMPLNCTPAATSARALAAEAASAAKSCAVDFGFWGGVVPGNLGELRAMWELGALGFKCFLVHSGVDDFPGVSKSELEAAMPILRELGATLLVHAEDPTVIEAAREPSGLARSPSSYAAYLASRPAAAEDFAVQMMVEMCRKTRARVHIVHVAAATAVPLIAKAKAEGLPVSAETCPHYLTLCAEDIEDGQTQFKCAPPIRDRATQDALWRALGDGVLDLVASDHSPCPPELKLLEAGNFANAWGGISSLQLTLPALWTQAKACGFTPVDIARLLCAGPAKLAGIDGFKGKIAPGYDADLVIWDPEARWTVRGSALHHRHKLTPYDGRSVLGAVRATFVRGKQVFGVPGAWAGFGAAVAEGFSQEAVGRWVKRSRE